MRLILPLCFLFLTACGPRLDAINWYLRIEHTEDCGDYALYGGEYSILCPVQDAIWNGDTLLVKSADICYFINATDYKDHQPLTEIPCADFRSFIRVGPTYWANGQGPDEESRTTGH